MAKNYEVLNMLIPNGGWVQNGSKYEDIQFLECEPITEAQYDAGFAQYDAWKAERQYQWLARILLHLDCGRSFVCYV